MLINIAKDDKGEFSLDIKLNFTGSTMLDKEVELQKMLNEIGKKVTKEILKNYDTKGEPVLVENIKYTKKGVFPEKYETIYGKIEVERNIYQNCNGGKTVCPMEHNARFILNSTPYFAKILAYKFINMSGLAVSNDLKETVGRKIDSTYARKIVDCIGNIAIENNEKSSLQLQESGKGNQVKSISIGLDSSSISIDNKKKKSQKKRIMAGTISLFDNYNHRIYTKYFAQNTSESGDAFLTKFKNEIDEIKKSYPNVNCYGIASQINFEDLKDSVNSIILDYEYPYAKIKEIAKLIYPKTVDDKQRIDWLTEKSHSLKNYADAVNCLLEELKLKQKELGKKKRKQLNKIISFIDRHKDNMNYHKEMRNGRAICSGINTTASRELIEERLCKPGAPWSKMGASSILALRTKAMSERRWSGFWNNIMENGTNQTKTIELRLE